MVGAVHPRHIRIIEMTVRPIAGGAVIGGAAILAPEKRARPLSGGAANDDFKPAAPHRRLDAKRSLRAEAQIDIVPEHRRIPALRGSRTRNDAAVSMALDNVEAGIEGRFIESVGELAQAAADAPHKAAFAQLAALDKAPPAGRTPDLL